MHYLPFFCNKNALSYTNIYFFFIIAKCKVEKMKNIIKLVKVICQVLIFLILIDQAMSQCGIRWRGTCDTKSSAKRQM